MSAALDNYLRQISSDGELLDTALDDLYRKIDRSEESLEFDSHHLKYLTRLLIKEVQSLSRELAYANLAIRILAKQAKPRQRKKKVQSDS